MDARTRAARPRGGARARAKSVCPRVTKEEYDKLVGPEQRRVVKIDHGKIKHVRSPSLFCDLNDPPSVSHTVAGEIESGVVFGWATPNDSSVEDQRRQARPRSSRSRIQELGAQLFEEWFRSGSRGVMPRAILAVNRTRRQFHLLVDEPGCNRKVAPAAEM
jgi:hypothetical protein